MVSAAQGINQTIQQLPFSYFLAHVPASRQPYVLGQIAKRGAERMQKRIEARLQAFGLVTASPLQRWLFYSRIKTPQMWQLQEQNYPKRYEEDRQDEAKLITRALAGDFGELEVKMAQRLLAADQPDPGEQLQQRAPTPQPVLQ